MTADPQLVLLAKYGERNAIAELHTKNLFIIKLLLSIYDGCISLQDAEDAYQDAFISFIRNPGSVSATTDKNFSAWLIAVCRNKIRDLLKSADYKRKATFPEGAEIDHVITSKEFNPVEEEIIIKQQWETLVKAVCKLSAEDRGIVLKIIKGLPQKEIAKELGISYQCLRQRRHRIIKRLQKLLCE